MKAKEREFIDKYEALCKEYNLTIYPTYDCELFITKIDQNEKYFSTIIDDLKEESNE